MSSLPAVPIRLLTSTAIAPVYATAGAIGADLHADIPEALEIQPGERIAIPTGVAGSVPPGYYGRIAPRSGLAVRHGLHVLAGVIDPDYHGEWVVCLANLGEEPCTIGPGHRIAQIVFERAERLSFGVVQHLGVTDRGRDGFGSTGTGPLLRANEGPLLHTNENV